MKRQVKLLALILTLLFTAQSPAMLGTSFTYQGEVYKDGQPLNGNNYSVYMRIYDDQIAGNLIQSDSDLSVDIVNGLFSVEYDVGQLPFMQNKDLWLEVEIAGLETVTFPRQHITSTPFALHAQTVADNSISGTSIFNNSIGEEDLGNLLISTIKIQDSAVTSSKIDNSAITTAKILDAAVTGSKLASSSILSSHIVNYSLKNEDFELNSVNSAVIENGTVTADDVNSASVQERVSGSCMAGSSIREIHQNGTVTCETDDSGSAGWALTGNSGTSPGTNYIGTSDNQDFVVKVNGEQAMKVESTSSDEASNFVLGHYNNTVKSGVEGSSILGGGNYSFFNKITEDNSVISGGRDNTIGDDDTDYGDGFGSTISGGTGNSVNGQGSTISGGSSNQIVGHNSSIPGGQSNAINSNYSLAAGFGSKANHIGSWVWNDYSDSNSANSFVTTADHQFLIRATGGVGIGTSSPASPLNIVADGTTSGSPTGSNEVVLKVESKSSSNNAAVVVNKLSGTSEAALVFSNANTAEYDFRSYQTTFDFNYYHPTNGRIAYLRYNPLAERIDIEGNVEPYTNDQNNLGGASYRWSTIYSVNPLDTSSDKRLKKDITDLKYGLAEVLKLNPVSYYWKEKKNGKLHLGLIAQEVEAIIPELVSKADNEEQTRSMRYAELIPVLVKATQEQQVFIDQQASQIDQLQQLVEELLNSQKSQ